MKPSERIREIAGVSRLEISGLLAAVLVYLDESEERRHPIARVPLLDGLREAKAEATPRLQEKVDANPSGFIRPEPASPPSGEEAGLCIHCNRPKGKERADGHCNAHVGTSFRDNAECDRAAGADLAEPYLYVARKADEYSDELIECSGKLREVTEERDALRARVEELDASLGRAGELVEKLNRHIADLTDRNYADGWVKYRMPESAPMLTSMVKRGTVEHPAEVAAARIQQLEGELSESDLALRVATSDNDTLRAEVNRLNAEAFELKRKLEEAEASLSSVKADPMWGRINDLGARVLADLEKSDAVVEAVRKVASLTKDGAGWETFGRLYHEHVAPRIAELDQPSEPKPKEVTDE